MPKVATIKAPEQFIVHCNDYDIQFDAVAVTVAGVSGDILESASAKVSSLSTEVLGILAEDTDGTGKVRVLVRGNPSSVDREKLGYGDAVESSVDALLNAKGIVVVNNQ